MSVDLHIHTNASDGMDTPSQVVHLAWNTGLEAIAITDHDTLDGIWPALQAGRRVSVEIIPGVELSTEYNELEFHVLGYLLDEKNRHFTEHLRKMRREREDRALKMARNLQSLGIPVTYEQLKRIAGRATVGRPHIARALIELGFVESPAQAFDRYIGRTCPAYVPRFKYTPHEAIQLIIKANGVPVLAHPGLTGYDEIIPELVKSGLKGLEVYYPEHTDQQIDQYLYLCRKYELIPTGGSDYHGSAYKEHNQLAAATVDYLIVKNLKRTAGLYK